MHGNRSVVVAVVFAGVVQVTSYYIVGVIAVGYGVMSTTGRVLVGGVVTVTFVVRCAIGGVGSAYGDFVVVDMVVVHIVHMPVV